MHNVVSRFLTMTLLGTLLLVGLPRAATAGSAIDLPETGEYTIDATWPLTVADDWEGAETGWITGFRFSACWQGDNVGTVDSLLVRIHSGASVVDYSCYYWQPDQILWQRMVTEILIDTPSVSPEARIWSVPPLNSFSGDDNTLVFPYVIDLDSIDWFWQEMGDDYWLSVSAFVADAQTTAWGVASATVHRGALATSTFWGTGDWLSHDYYFVPKDYNNDGEFTEEDKSYVVAMCGIPLFPEGRCYPGLGWDALWDADANCLRNISDCVYLIAWALWGGPSPDHTCYPSHDLRALAFALTSRPAPYLCGDADRNDAVNISDAVYLINYIFADGPLPDPLLSGDVNCDGIVNISDAVYLIAYIFGGGPDPCAECPS